MAFVAEANLVCGAAGFDSVLESDSHPDWVGSDRDGGIHEHGVRTEFHGFSRVAGCTESGIHDDRYKGLVDDDSDLVSGA